MSCLHECRRLGYQDIILDFSRCESAFPNGMIPLLPHADMLRREGVDLSVELPIPKSWLGCFATLTGLISWSLRVTRKAIRYMTVIWLLSDSMTLPSSSSL